MRLNRSLVAVAVGAVAAAVPAAADVDVAVDIAVQNGFKVRGTLNPGSEIERFRIEAPAGATLKVTAVGRKAKGAAAAPRVTFAVIGPDDADLTAGSPPTPKGASGATWTGVAQSSGVHAILVEGDGVEGNYDVTASFKVPKKLAISGDSSWGEAEHPFELASGSSVSVTVKRTAGSDALPRLTQVCSDGGCAAVFGTPANGATSHSGRFTPSTTGAWSVFVGDAGTGGPYEGTLTVTLPKVKSKRVDLTDATVGAGAVATGAVIGAGGGAVTVDGGLSGIEGAGVTVPGGALTLPTAVVVASSTPLTPRERDLAGGGPAVFFGPEGTAFAVAATVTIPYDPLPPGVGTGDLRIFVRDAKGKVSEVVLAPPAAFAFDTVNRTVSFPVTHFSSYQAFGPRRSGPFDFDGDGVQDLLIPSPSETSNSGSVTWFRGGDLPAALTSSQGDGKFSGAPGEELGRFVASGDLNADGIADAVIAKRNPMEIGIVFGRSTFGSASGPDVRITGSAPDLNFGNKVLAADVNGDGADDLIVGDESSDRAGNGGGAVLIFFGPITADAVGNDADVILTGEAAADLFGAAIAVGDVIGGPGTDLVVGADQIDTTGATGRCYVFAGPIAAGARSASSALAILTGEGTDSGFGVPLGVGDVDGGGKGDLIVCAVEFNPGAAPSTGRIYVFHGEDGIVSASATTADAVLSGVASGDRFGAGGVFVADVTGDGANDLVTSAPGADDASGDEGVVAVFTNVSTQTWATARRFYGEPSDRFGIGIHPPVDVNGDGVADVIGGSPVAASGNGVVRILFGGAFGANISAPAASVRITGAPGQGFGGKD